MDAETQIIVAAELSNCAADSGQLPPMLDAVERNLDALPARALADAGYRSEATLEKLADSPCEVIVALGREGREDAKIDAERYPRTAAMAVRLQTEAGKTAYRRRKAIVEAPNGWINAGLPAVQFQRHRESAGRVEARLHGPEFAADGVFMNRTGGTSVDKSRRLAPDGHAECAGGSASPRSQGFGTSESTQSRYAATRLTFCRADS